jgi:hypothetical protein
LKYVVGTYRDVTLHKTKVRTMVLVQGGFSFDIFMTGLKISIDVDLFKIFG